MSRDCTFAATAIFHHAVTCRAVTVRTARFCRRRAANDKDNRRMDNELTAMDKNTAREPPEDDADTYALTREEPNRNRGAG
jgi:hypothetical protein